MCPKWNHGMSSLVTQLCDKVMVDEQPKPNEEEEATTTDKAPITGHVVNMHQYILATYKNTTDKEHPSDGPA